MVRSGWATLLLHRDCWPPVLVLKLLCNPGPVVKLWPKMPSGRPPTDPDANAEPEPEVNILLFQHSFQLFEKIANMHRHR